MSVPQMGRGPPFGGQIHVTRLPIGPQRFLMSYGRVYQLTSGGDGNASQSFCGSTGVGWAGGVCGVCGVCGTGGEPGVGFGSSFVKMRSASLVTILSDGPPCPDAPGFAAKMVTFAPLGIP